MNVFKYKHVASLLLIASSVRAAEQRPTNCVGDRIVAGEQLSINEAICSLSWAYGINSDGVGGLWQGDSLIDTYATGVSEIVINDDSEDGSEAYVSMFDEDSNILWDLSCTEQAGNTTAKLIIQDGNHVVKFTKGIRIYSVEDGVVTNLHENCILYENIASADVAITATAPAPAPAPAPVSYTHLRAHETG